MRKKIADTAGPKRRKTSLPLLWQARVIAHAPSFRWRAFVSSRAIARSPAAREDQAWLDSISWWNSEEAAALLDSGDAAPWWRTNNQND